MKKADRELIFNKYDGRCAYCGCILEKGWHVDELLPVKRNYKWRDAYWENMFTGEKISSLHIKPEGTPASHYNRIKGKYIPNGMEHPERLNLDNQMPACASCNINKHSLSLEEFRSLIEGFMFHLNKHSTQYKIAKRYSLVKEDIKSIVFYFETVNHRKS